MDDDDGALIESARNGQPGAAAFVVSKFAPRLAGYCRSITPDMGDVDRDHIVALGLENALRKIDRYDPSRGPLEPWLRSFVNFAAKDWRRSPARTLTYDPTDQDGPLAEVAAPAASPDAPTSNRLADAVAALHDALPQLSVPDQVILALRDVEGRPFKDIATRLEITEPSARQRHHRAKSRLKKLMEADSRTSRLTGENS